MKQKHIFFSVMAIAVLAACSIANAHAASFIPATVMQGGGLLSGLAEFGSLGGLSAMAFGMGSMVPAGGNHAAKTKFFRVALEGATTDGRTIERTWIEQIAKNYDSKKYGARINLEHFRGLLPDGPFKAYGDVTAVEAREEADGKIGLYAQLEPTPALIEMTKAKQKIYTSCEIDPSFADTKEAYLVGLAVTDSPASLGTEILTFAANNPTKSPFSTRKTSPNTVFTATVDEVSIELEEQVPALALFSRVKELLGLVKKNTDSNDTRFADITQAVETLATHASEQAGAFQKQSDVVAQLLKKVGDQEAQANKDREAFTALQVQLASTGNGQPARPAATGATGAIATDC